MSPNDYYFKLGRTVTLTGFEPQWFDDITGGIHNAIVPDEYLDPFLLDIRKKYIGVTLLFRLPAHTFYMWHADRKRKCALNFELTHANSVTYVGVPGYRGNLDKLEAVDYDNQLILLDTSQQHSIANLDKQRVIFTLGINNASYLDVKTYIMDKYTMTTGGLHQVNYLETREKNVWITQ